MTGLAELAIGAWQALWKLYDKKYGKYGERRVKALQAYILKQQTKLTKYRNDLSTTQGLAKRYRKERDASYKETDKLIKEMSRLRRAVWWAENRSRVAPAVPLDANPYEDEELNTGDIEIVEESDR